MQKIKQLMFIILQNLKHHVHTCHTFAENEYYQNYRINQYTYTIHQVMRIYPQQKQPWNNLTISAGNRFSTI